MIQPENNDLTIRHVVVLSFEFHKSTGIVDQITVFVGGFIRGKKGSTSGLNFYDFNKTKIY